MKHDYKVLGTYLKQKRKKSKLSQFELAKSLNYHAQFVSNWERGLSSPPASALKKLVKILHLDVKTILRIILKEQERFWIDHLT